MDSLFDRFELEVLALVGTLALVVLALDIVVWR